MRHVGDNRPRLAAACDCAKTGNPASQPARIYMIDPSLPEVTIQFEETVVQEAILALLSSQQVSIVVLQLHFRFGYSCARQLMRTLELRGVVRYFNSDGVREFTADYKGRPE